MSALQDGQTYTTAQEPWYRCSRRSKSKEEANTEGLTGSGIKYYQPWPCLAVFLLCQSRIRLDFASLPDDRHDTELSEMLCHPIVLRHD